MRAYVAMATGCFGVITLLAAHAGAAGTGTGGTTTSTAKGIALDQFDPAPPGDSFFGVPSPFARGDLVPRALVYFDYADQPLKYSLRDQDASVVGRQAFLHVAASLTVQDRLLIHASVPFALVQAGGDPKLQGYRVQHHAQAGDLRLGARVRMIGDDTDPFQLGIGLNVFVPTAAQGAFVGDGTVRVAPQIIAGGRFQARTLWIWSAMLGTQVRTSAAPTTFTWSAAFGALFFQERIQAGVELIGTTPLQEGTYTIGTALKIPAAISTNAEVLIGSRVRVWRDLVAGWAFGPGITRAIGTPDVRFVGSIGWAPGLPRPKVSLDQDTDGDGLADRFDACPYAFGVRSKDVKKDGCPVLDDDEDGIPNDEDACPNEYGPRSKDPKKNGCASARPKPPGPPPPPPRR